MDASIGLRELRVNPRDTGLKRENKLAASSLSRQELGIFWRSIH
jgi:hypothetical protein